jgi:hypothetical protein
MEYRHALLGRSAEADVAIQRITNLPDKARSKYK